MKMYKRYKFIVVMLVIVLSISNGFGAYHMAAAEESAYPKVTKELNINTIKVGSTVDIGAKITVNDISVGTIIYESEDISIATVSIEGKITGIKAGKVLINYYAEKYPDSSGYVYLTVVDNIIKITGPMKYVAGKTYQLKASQKNVIWSISNREGLHANASIDSSTGKIKARNAGMFHVFCKSIDGKSLGGVDIYVTGPIIVEQPMIADAITITKDEHISSINELKATGKLPKTITLSYMNGTKKGNVDATISWDFYGTFKQGTYTLSATIKVPEGYFIRNYTTASIDIIFKKEQTDTRKKIVSIEDTKTITLSKDMHLRDAWDILKGPLSKIKLKCTLDDGSIVELPINGIGCPEGDNYSQIGTYNCKLYPKATAGYITDYYTSSNFKLKVTKKQTSTASNKLTIDIIAGESYVVEPISQAYFGDNIIETIVYGKE